jgi:hypothetical protein
MVAFLLAFLLAFLVGFLIAGYRTAGPQRLPLGSAWGGGWPVRRGIWVGPRDGSYGQAVTARSSRSGSSAVARSSAAASAESSW